MNKVFFFLCFILSILFSNEKKFFCYFCPPSEWECVDPKALSSLIQVGFIGKGKQIFRPSLNLAEEQIDCSMEEYLKAVKEIYESDLNTEWRDLGTFQTKSGKAHLIEISQKTQWGDIRILQSILIHEKKAYILTGAVLKEEFSDQYKPLLNAMRSIQITDNLISAVKKTDLRTKLENVYAKLQKENGIKNFDAFHKLIIDEYKEMGMHWQMLMVKYVADGFLQQKTHQDR